MIRWANPGPSACRQCRERPPWPMIRVHDCAGRLPAGRFCTPLCLAEWAVAQLTPSAGYTAALRFEPEVSRYGPEITRGE